MTNKCAFGNCQRFDGTFNCKECGENTKNQGYTGCVFASYKDEKENKTTV